MVLENQLPGERVEEVKRGIALAWNCAIQMSCEPATAKSSMSKPGMVPYSDG